MIISSKDLYLVSKCPKKYFKEGFEDDVDNPSRKLIRSFFLMKGVGKELDWSPKYISKVWDNYFWEGKDINKDNINTSIKGIIAAKKLFDKLPKGERSTPYAGSPIQIQTDSGCILKSGCDFVLDYQKRIEGWLFVPFTWSLKEIRNSPLPAIEYFIFNNKMSGFQLKEKDFYLILYRIKPENLEPIYIRIKNPSSIEESRRITFHLVDQIRKKISYPVSSNLCKKCEGCVNDFSTA